MVHEAAARGFGSTTTAETYERGRPSYPDAAVDLVAGLGAGPGRTVVDLGAGTGKWSRLLAARGARVVAVEPVAAMREALTTTSPGVEVIDAPAEEVPLPNASVDVVTGAQSFHWFEHRRALAEAARLLRAGGALALLWNEREQSVPWVAELGRIVHAPRSGVPSYDEDLDWRALVSEGGSFTPLEHRSFSHAQALDEAGLLDRVSSTSYIAVLPDEQRSALLDEVRALVAGFPDRFELPYRTDVFWCRRR